LLFLVFGSVQVAATCEVDVYDCDDLQDMRDDLACYYYMQNDIDCSDTVNWNGGAGFEPIGTDGDEFTGRFFGQGHAIHNLYINRPETNYVGLFGKASGDIQDVGLRNVDITGKKQTGGLVGEHSGCGGIQDTYTTGTVAGGTPGSLSGRVGGLVGRSYCTIQDSYSTADVMGNSKTGGLVGRNYGTIENSFSTGSVTGDESTVDGLVGTQSGTIINCFWLDRAGDTADECYKGAGGADPECVKKTDESYFYDVADTNEPFDVWDFISTWSTIFDDTDYPPLRNEDLCTDNDGDGFFLEDYCPGEVDCDDADEDVNPGIITEKRDCSDGKDNDCDGKTDCHDKNCKRNSHCKRYGSTVGYSFGPITSIPMPEPPVLVGVINQTPTPQGAKPEPAENGGAVREELAETAEGTPAAPLIAAQTEDLGPVIAWCAVLGALFIMLILHKKIL